MQPAELAYNFTIPASGGLSTNYIDLAQCASAVNRRLYQQGKNYYVSRVVLASAGATNLALSTLPDNWVTPNAWVKAKSMWDTMNQGVLKDNPSVKGKWADFKVFFDEAHYAGGATSAGPTLNLLPTSGAVGVRTGEWYMSRFISPQHDVDPTSGVELAADEFNGHMMGDDNGSPGSYNSVGIIKGYATTRARVQIAPDVPAGMQTNWMTELSDLGGQDPELANVIEDANDNPPYDLDDYPGGDANFNGGVVQAAMATTTTLLLDKEIGFKVPLGLLKLQYTGAAASLLIYLTPGNHKGLLCSDVRQ